MKDCFIISSFLQNDYCENLLCAVFNVSCSPLFQVQLIVWQARRRTCWPWRRPGTTSCRSPRWNWCRPTRRSAASTWATSLTRSSWAGPCSSSWSCTSRERSSPASTHAITLRRSVWSCVYTPYKMTHRYCTTTFYACTIALSGWCETVSATRTYTNEITWLC